MWFNDFLRGGFKIFREKTAGVASHYKANQGFEVTDQSLTDGDYTTAKPGEEEGWIYIDKTGSTRQIGAWTQACPAVWDSSSSISILKDKTQAMDADFATKTTSSSAGDSSTTVRVATVVGNLVPGIIVGCANHAAQEQIFFPIASQSITKYAQVAWSCTADDDFSEGELMTYDATADTYTQSGEQIWIDTYKSLPDILFTTAGDGTIFEVIKIGSVTRKNSLRDLYRVARTIQDQGDTILLAQGTQAFPTTEHCNVILMKSSVAWLHPEEAYIYTTIIKRKALNRLYLPLCEDWHAVDATNYYKWLRIQNWAPLRLAPVRPILQNRDEKTFRDYNTMNNTPISYYQGQ